MPAAVVPAPLPHLSLPAAAAAAAAAAAVSIGHVAQPSSPRRVSIPVLVRDGKPCYAAGNGSQVGEGLQCQPHTVAVSSTVSKNVQNYSTVVSSSSGVHHQQPLSTATVMVANAGSAISSGLPIGASLSSSGLSSTAQMQDYYAMAMAAGYDTTGFGSYYYPSSGYSAGGVGVMTSAAGGLTTLHHVGSSAVPSNGVIGYLHGASSNSASALSGTSSVSDAGVMPQSSSLTVGGLHLHHQQQQFSAGTGSLLSPYDEMASLTENGCYSSQTRWW